MMFLLIVTLSSMLLAAIMSVIAWRIAAGERRRSEARIAALSAEIHAPVAPMAAAASAGRSGPRRAEIGLRGEPPRLAAVPQPHVVKRWDADLPLHAVTTPASADLFAATPRPPASRALAFAVLAAAALGGVLLVAALLRGSGSMAVRAPAGDNQAVAAVQPAPLDLVALGHERDADHLIVRGVVRAPSGAAVVDQLTVVVFVFKADGGFLTSARAAVDLAALRSAGEASFVVTVPDAAAASRYRVSFRSRDRILPHVDRRELVKRS